MGARQRNHFTLFADYLLEEIPEALVLIWLKEMFVDRYLSRYENFVTIQGEVEECGR